MRRFAVLLYSGLLSIALLGAAAARADEPADEPVAREAGEGEAAAAAAPEASVLRPPRAFEAYRPGRFEAATAYWESQRSWRYGTQYLFALTRSLPQSGLPRRAQAPFVFLTAPVDVALLPFAALAGLFGP